MSLNQRLTAVVATLLLYAGLVAPSAQALSASANPTLNGQALATVTALSGSVFKCDFVDWEKEVWGEPATAVLNDKLHEGMQIGTGNNSWAEVAWPNVKTRAWANTVFAIAPNKRLVYLTGGEMLFRLDKNRKDKDQDYFIWTKVLQARIRGTSVLVQAKGTVTRFTVLEGEVDIFNRFDHSQVRLKPGVVLEVVGYQMPTGLGQTQNHSSAQPKPVEPPVKLDKAVTDILYTSDAKTPLFQDKYASTNVYPSNSEALKGHPLVTTAGGPIDSLPLIQKEQAELPGFNPLLPIRLADTARLNKVITSGVELKAVPSNVTYFVGDLVGKTIKLPESAGRLPPTGAIINLNSYRTSAQTPVITSVARTAPPIAMPAVPALTPPAQDTNSDRSADSGVFEEPLPVTRYAQPSLLTPAPVNSGPAVTTQNPAVAAFQPLPGTMPNFNNGMNAPMGAAGSASAAVSGLTNVVPMTNNLAPITNAVSPVINTVPGVLNNSANPITNTLQNTLQGAGKPLGNTLDNITNSSTGH